MNATLAPVSTVARVGSVDVLRGVAVLGILAMNIISFGLPMSAYVNPASEGLAEFAGKYEGLNRLSWWVSLLLFDQKMMALFSMLFGAGLVLMDGRNATRSAPETPPGRKKAGFAGIYYRRLLWLFAIGMVHAYLIWFGDILVAYALCGLLLYPLRKVRPAVLIPVGAAVLMFALVISSAFGGVLSMMSAKIPPIEAKLEAGEPITPSEQAMLDGFREQMGEADPTPEQARAEVEKMRGSVGEVLSANAGHAVFMQTLLFVTWAFWRALGLMLIGMGLMKLGVFAGERSTRFYATLAGVGYGVGLPLVAAGGFFLERSGFDLATMYLYAGHFNYTGSVLVALGHLAVVMLVVRAGVLRPVTARLAAVGRIPLTNYLTQSLLCTTLFFGWGLGMFGRFERAELWLVVAGVWTLQLLWSPWWVARFRFGPAEWLWRTVAYWKLQPWRHERPAPTPA